MKNKSLIATAVVFFFVGLASALTVRLVPMNHDHGSHAPDLPEEEISILHQPPSPTFLARAARARRFW